MVVISQTTILNCLFMNEKFGVLIPKFVPNGSIENKWVLVQVMTWHRTGAKPLPEPLLTCLGED